MNISEKMISNRTKFHQISEKSGEQKYQVGFDASCVTVKQQKNIFLNLVKSNQNWNVITLFRLVCYQAELRLMPNQSGKCNYNPNLV